MSQEKKTEAPAITTENRTTSASASTKTQGTKVQGKDRNLGSALRSVYQKTVEEPVPDDLIDLLGKLG